MNTMPAETFHLLSLGRCYQPVKVMSADQLPVRKQYQFGVPKGLGPGCSLRALWSARWPGRPWLPWRSSAARGLMFGEWTKTGKRLVCHVKVIVAQSKADPQTISLLLCGLKTSVIPAKQEELQEFGVKGSVPQRVGVIWWRWHTQKAG